MASESRNLAQQRREKDGIVYFERGILTGRDGRRYQRYAIQTHFVEVGESAAELVKKYVLPLAQPGDVLSITAKVMAMCTGNVRRMEDMKLGFFAKHMAKFAGINSTGVGMHEPYKLQLSSTWWVCRACCWRASSAPLRARSGSRACSIKSAVMASRASTASTSAPASTATRPSR